MCNALTKEKPKKFHGTYAVKTIKGAYWYKDKNNLVSMLKKEVGWLAALISQHDAAGIQRQSQLIKELGEELERINR